MFPISRGLYPHYAIETNRLHAFYRTRFTNVWSRSAPSHICMTASCAPNALVQFPSRQETMENLCVRDLCLYPRCAIKTNKLYAFYRTRFTNVWSQPVPSHICRAASRVPNALVQFPSKQEIVRHLSSHPCIENLCVGDFYLIHGIINTIADHFHNLKIGTREISEKVNKVVHTLELNEAPPLSNATSLMIKVRVTRAILDNLADIVEKD